MTVPETRITVDQYEESSGLETFESISDDNGLRVKHHVGRKEDTACTGNKRWERTGKTSLDAEGWGSGSGAWMLHGRSPGVSPSQAVCLDSALSYSRVRQ